MRINKDASGFISINGLSFPKVNTSGSNINFAIEENNPKIKISFSNGIKIAEANYENISFNDDSNPGVYNKSTFALTLQELKVYLFST